MRAPRVNQSGGRQSASDMESRGAAAKTFSTHVSNGAWPKKSIWQRVCKERGTERQSPRRLAACVGRDHGGSFSVPARLVRLAIEGAAWAEGLPSVRRVDVCHLRGSHFCMPASEISVIDEPVWAEEGVGDAGVREGLCLASRSVHACGHLGGMEWHLQRYSLRDGGSVDGCGEWQAAGPESAFLPRVAPGQGRSMGPRTARPRRSETAGGSQPGKGLR